MVEAFLNERDGECYEEKDEGTVEDELVDCSLCAVLHDPPWVKFGIIFFPIWLNSTP